MAKKIKESINPNSINLDELTSTELYSLLQYTNSYRNKGKDIMRVIFNLANMGVSVVTSGFFAMNMLKNLPLGDNVNLNAIMVVAPLMTSAYFGTKAYKAFCIKEDDDDVLLDESIKQIFTNCGLEWEKLTKKEREQFRMLITQKLYYGITDDKPNVKSL